MRSKINFTIVVILFIAIGYLSLSNLPENVTNPQGFDISYFGHFFAYFCLSSSLLVYFEDKKFEYKEAIIIASVYGLTMEIAQSFISYRLFSGFDMIANISGSSLILLNIRFKLPDRFIWLEERFIEFLQNRLR